MKIFLQRSNSEPVSLGRLALDDSLDLFRQHDWDSEILAEEQLRSEERHCCSPCIEWLSDSGSALTVVPTSRGANIVYRSGEKQRILGVIPTPADAIISVSEVPDHVLDGILSSHYRGDKGIERLILKVGRPTQIFR